MADISAAAPAPSRQLSPRHERRIGSILRQHAVLFADGVVGSDPLVRRECQELLESLDRLSGEQAAHVVSILRQHEIMFGPAGGLAPSGGAGDYPELVAALLERAPRAAGPVREPEQGQPRERPRESTPVEPAGPEPAEPSLAPAPEPLLRSRPARVRASRVIVETPTPALAAGLLPEVPASSPSAGAEVLPGPGLEEAPLPPPAKPEPRPRIEPLGDADIRLFGPGRRRSLPEGRAMLLFHYYSDSEGRGSACFIPIDSLASLELRSDPVIAVVRGSVHAMLVESRAGSGGAGPLPAPFTEDELYSINLRSGGSIHVSIKPRAPAAPSTIVGSPEQGVFGYLIPAGSHAFDRTVTVLGKFLSRSAGIATDTSDSVAYFAARRLAGFGFSGLG